MKYLLSLFFLVNAPFLFAQVTPGAKILLHTQGDKKPREATMELDTSSQNKEPRYFYLTVNASTYVNTLGNFARRFSPGVEFGRTYGIFDMGIATGLLNVKGERNDTAQFIELRPTINVFSKGRFAEALCLGGGYVFGATQGLMTEVCNSINFNIDENWAIAVIQGYEYFDGVNGSRPAQYMGLNVTYNFLKSNGINKLRKRNAIISDN